MSKPLLVLRAIPDSNERLIGPFEDLVGRPPDDEELAQLLPHQDWLWAEYDELRRASEELEEWFRALSR
jgi:hypothetical protein